jgi:hypothetical protein
MIPMKKISTVTGLLVLIAILCGFQFHYTDQTPDSKEKSRKNKYYEYPGDYGQEVQKLMDKFKADFGYELVEFGQAWHKGEMERLHAAFSELPPTFYRLPGVKGLYRLEGIMVSSGKISAAEIPAAVLPAFNTVYEQESKSYKVFVGDQDPRAEFYNGLFYEDETNFKNIVHHEMAHLFDMTHGFLSFSEEWSALTKFRILNIPALDGKANSDFRYMFLNSTEVDNYAPISIRHLPTYSRQNMQEDFANSVAAYIHYPYFQYSHPARYKFLKEKVFGGKDYFPAGDKNQSYSDKIFADLEAAIAKKDWSKVTGIIVEVSRGYHPELESRMVLRLQKIVESGPAEKDQDHQLAFASCYLLDPNALEFRKRLIKENRVPVEKFLKQERCVRVSGTIFTKSLVKWPLANALFFREKGRDYIQFLDPVMAVAHLRGYDTRYVWRLFAEGAGARPIAQGNLVVTEGGNGSVKIDLAATAENKFTLPDGNPLVLELGAVRNHPKNFKTFNSEISKIGFVTQPWFRYLEPERPNIRVIYPFRAAYKQFN